MRPLQELGRGPEILLLDTPKLVNCNNHLSSSLITQAQAFHMLVPGTLETGMLVKVCHQGGLEVTAVYKFINSKVQCCALGYPQICVPHTRSYKYTTNGFTVAI